MAADTSPSEVRPAGGFAALRDGYFARYLSTFLLSLTGMWVRVTAMGFLVYALTKDPLQLGIIQFLLVAPEIILGPVVAAYLDRLDRRRLLVAIQAVYVVSMGTVAVLVMTGVVQMWHLMVISVATGAAAAFDWPARMSLVPSLVPRDMLRSAVALNSTVFNGSRVIGPTIGGWMLGALGVAACFTTTAVFYVPFLIVLLLMPASRRPVAHISDRSPWADLADGLRYVWQHRPIRAMLTVDLVPVMIGMSYLTMAPAFASDILHDPERGLGLLLAANGIGAFVGALIATRLSVGGRRGLWVNSGVLAFGLMLVGFGQTGSIWLTLPTILVTGLTYACYSTLNDTLIQTMVEESYRGRVSTLYSMVWGLSPIGGLIAGALARWVGLQWSISLSGVIVILYMLYLWFGTPLRHVD